jgi:hypothetical protein
MIEAIVEMVDTIVDMKKQKSKQGAKDDIICVQLHELEFLLMQ